MRWMPRVAAVVGFLIGVLIWRFPFEETPWPVRLFLSPGVLILLPLTLINGLNLNTILGLLPFTNALVYWLPARLSGRLHRRLGGWWIPAVMIVMSSCYVLAGGLLAFRETLDDRIHIAFHPQTGVFDWGRGQVTFPTGFTYQRVQGIDTWVGQFTSADGKVVLQSDIGELAGEHGGLGFGESEYLGSRLYSARQRSQEGRLWGILSFPDNGCAVFAMSAPHEDDLVLLDQLRSSFRPHNLLPAWVLRRLPDIARTECREAAIL